MPFLLLFLLLAGCAHTSKPAPLPDEIPLLILTPKPENRALSAAEVATYKNQVVYSADDEAIYAALTFHQFKNRHTVKWRWIAPLGRIYLETASIPVGTRGALYKDVTVFHKISLRGEMAEKLAGLWKVQAIVDGGSQSLSLVEQTFRVDPVLPPPLPPPLPLPLPPPPPPPPPSPDDLIVIAPPLVEIFFQSLPRIEPSVTSTLLESAPPLTLFFGVREAVLTPETKKILIEQMETFKRAKRIVISGYHDAVGSISFNRHLALKRAERVSDFLITYGVALEVIQTQGKEQVYFAPNNTREGRRQNRRVTIEIEE